VNSIPHLIVIGGPNGAGKSTAAPSLLRDTLQVVDYVNADAIAQGLSAFRPERAAMPAGRFALQHLRHLAEQRLNFAFESTLAGRSLATFIGEAKARGYVFHLAFLWLPDAAMAVARVHERVRVGGHDVPETTIRRRYTRGLENFFRIYQTLADHWRLYDNSQSGPRLVAMGSHRNIMQIHDAKTWGQVNGENGDG